MLALVPCAVCRTTRFEPVYAATIANDAADPSCYFGSSRTRAEHLPIVRCAACGLTMTNPQDDRATLARVYAAHEDPVYEGENESRRCAALRHLALIRRYRPNPTSIVDVGCATGIFVAAAQEVGWQATGVDASEWMVARARSRCPTVTFQVGRLEDIALPAHAFDVATLWDVLEHLPAPAEALEQVRDWLVPRGWLFLSVPNAASVVARVMGGHWVLLLREHLWYFSPHAMETLLARAGFEMVRARPKLVQFSLANVLGRLTQYPGPLSPILGHVSRISAFKGIQLRFPMGEMDVVARVK